MDLIKFYGLGSLFDAQLTAEINPVLSQTKPAKEQSLPVEDITKIVDDLNHSLSQLSTTLRFNVDSESDVFYVAVIDTKTKEMLRRFPIEELPTSTAIRHNSSGIFLNTKS
jgi:flagellar protein FlaG